MRDLKQRYKIHLGGQKEVTTSFKTIQKAFSYFTESMKIWPNNRIKIVDSVTNQEWENKPLTPGYRYQIYIGDSKDMITSSSTFERALSIFTNYVELNPHDKIRFFDRETNEEWFSTPM